MLIARFARQKQMALRPEEEPIYTSVKPSERNGLVVSNTETTELHLRDSKML
jgi:hypothetical protein